MASCNIKWGAAAKLRNEDLKPAKLMGLIMSDDNAPAETGPSHTGKTNSWRRHLPYLLVLALALAGVAYANMSQKSLAGYWELLALISGIMCIFSEWGKTEDKEARVRLVWTQAVHWIAVLVAMNIMLLSGVQQLLPAPATSLVLLMLLALGSFLAGLNFTSLELCFLGLVLALAVPALSWVKQSILFIILAGAFVVGIGTTFWSTRKEK
jgi:hypothetical protein